MTQGSSGRGRVAFVCRADSREAGARRGAARGQGVRPQIRVDRAAYVQVVGLVAVVALLAVRTGAAPVLALTHGLVAAAAALLTFGWHEAGHALTARACGLRVHAIKVRGVLDGVTVRDVAPRPGVDATVILAGPGASLLLGLLGLVVALATADPFSIGRILAMLNLLALLASLTMGRHSDGGRAWRALRAHRAALREQVLVHEQGHMDPVLGVDLGEDRGDLVSHGLVGDSQSTRDLGVRRSGAEQPDDLELAG